MFKGLEPSVKTSPTFFYFVNATAKPESVRDKDASFKSECKKMYFQPSKGFCSSLLSKKMAKFGKAN